MKLGSKYWYFIIAAVLLISFQNCTPNSNQGSSNRNSTILQGNGEPYDGKLFVEAPDVMGPGQTVEIEVKGGLPPYAVQSDASTGSFVQKSTNLFDFSIGRNETSNSIQLSATDARGDVYTVQIQIWGVNKWFFSGISGVVSDSQGNIFVAETDRPSLTKLDAQANVLSRTSSFGGSSLVSPGQMVIDSQDNIYLVESDSSIAVVNAATLQLQRTYDDSNRSRWNSCGGIRDLKILTTGLLAVACRTDIFVLDESSQSVDEISLDLNSGESLGAFAEALDGSGYVVVSERGFLNYFNSDGELQRRFQLSGKTAEFYDELEARQIVQVSASEFIFVPRMEYGGPFAFDITTGAITSFFLGDVSHVYHAGFRSLFALPNGEILTTEDASGNLIRYNSNYQLTHAYGPNKRESGAFYYPTDIVFQGGQLTIVDTWNYRLAQYSPTGELLRLLTSPDTSWWLKHTNDIVVDEQGVIYGTNPGGGHIIAVEPNGNVREIDIEGSPQGIALLNQNILLVTKWNRHVEAYDLNGNLLYRFQEPSGRPKGITVVGDKVYVLDYEHRRIKIFTTAGEFLGYFDSPPQNVEPLSRSISHIIFDPNKEVFLVSDSGNDRIVVYSKNGEFQGVFGARGFEAGQMRDPRGLAIGPRGELYLVDHGNSRIQVFYNLPY